MLPDGAIHVDHLWKRFRLDAGGPLLSEQMRRLAARLRGRQSARWRWALRDVDLRIEPGESVGLIGSNGSGKSTLLKILAGVMFPYAGRAVIGGRIGSLIEIHSGMHPDLTGAENVFLAGALVGASKRELAARFDEIVAFAEVEEAINRPLKFYSSGMRMRLGFSVASSIRPDVLLVDEVLAVGDADFQRKCARRMREMVDHGTTVVLVSHDATAIETLCTRSVWLDRGLLREDGPTPQVMAAYRESIEQMAAADVHEGRLRVAAAHVEGLDGDPRAHGDVRVHLTLEADAEQWCEIGLGFSQGAATPIFSVHRSLTLQPGRNQLTAECRDLPLAGGRYYIWAGARDAQGRTLMDWQPACAFDLAGPELHNSALGGAVRLAPVLVKTDWNI
jgi:ABC-type polysaccharide/polyol phosphate transport system ATPase subunit